MKVVGIDPGLRITGYACVEAKPRARATTPGILLIEAGSFRFAGERPVADRLVELEEDLRDLLARHGPDALGVEALFAHYRHPRTAITMAHARGVILLVAARMGIPLLEFPPAEVKRSLTGNGQSTKAQMQRAVQSQLGLPEAPDPPDVADAIAIAICAMSRVDCSLQS